MFSKRIYDIVNSNSDLKNVKCWNCKQKEHYSINCFQLKAVGVVIDEVQKLKKESTSQSRLKRNKKD